MKKKSERGRAGSLVAKHIFDGSKVFFTSDTHFNHTNILKFCDRPFKNVEEMNETMIANWNCIVGMDDDVFHLGDFFLGGAAEWTKMTSGNSLGTSTPARTTPE